VLTYTTPFPSNPVPFFTVGAAATPFFFTVFANAATFVEVQFTRSTGGNADPDTGFFFMAIQRF
jgi:hypothetical protein